MGKLCLKVIDMHYVYFVVQDIKTKKGQKPVKIGISSDVDNRVKNLQTASPHPLKVVTKLPFEVRREAEVVEKCCHRLAKAKHKALGGEWFYIFGSWPKFIDEVLKMAEKPAKQAVDALVKKTGSTDKKSVKPLTYAKFDFCLGGLSYPQLKILRDKINKILELESA